MAYIDQFIDTGLTPDESWDPTADWDHHVDRLAFEAVFSRMTLDHKRRLGEDATPRDLARDRQYAKRNMHGCLSLLKAYGATDRKINELTKKYQEDSQAKQIAAQIDWEEHLRAKIVNLRNSQRQIAVNGKITGKVKEANSLLLRLENEINSCAQRYELVFGTPISLQSGAKDPENTPEDL